MPAIKKARAIRRGAVVGIAAPAGPIDAERIEAGEALLRRLGFEPQRQADLGDRLGYLAGDDPRRASELMALIDDAKVEAIVCARGGYGSARILSRLDPARVRKARKPLVGYSDITSLLLWQRRIAGLMGIHGPMLERGSALDAESERALVRALTGAGPLPRLGGHTRVGGWGEGRLTGGSLSLVVASLGTPFEIDTRDAILMLEDTGEPPYRIDRMLEQLRAAGKLDGLVGIGLGSFDGCEDARYPDRELEDVLADALDGLGVPVVDGLPFGHGDVNLAWPMGARAAIDGDRGEVELLESAVAAR